ncbi:DUF2269 family protein [Alteraurantiacibacter aquimixticola]|nr:DUF2269 domain-containing protein [Alteraurantiacibacter aquimixticola]
MELYLLVKWAHILSSTVLFGFGAGTAWYFWNAHLSRDPATIATVGRMVVRADWIFTGTSGVAQPATGFWLVGMLGYPLDAPWLVLTYLLYLLAFACWVPVVWLQIRATRLAERAERDGTPLGRDYERTMRAWFILGWPAFLGLTGVFYLMVAKPQLW